VFRRTIGEEFHCSLYLVTWKWNIFAFGYTGSLPAVFSDIKRELALGPSYKKGVSPVWRD